MTCVNLQASSYLLFPASNHLSGSIDVYTDDECRVFHSTMTYGGEYGIAHAADAAAAEGICAGENDAGQEYAATVVAAGQPIWLCQLREAVAPSATNTATATATATSTATNTATATSTATLTLTSVQVQIGEKEIATVSLSSDKPGQLSVSWSAPTQAPVDYRVNWTVHDASYPTWTDLSGNAFPTGNSLTLTGLDHGTLYKVRVRARYDGPAGPWTGDTEALVMDHVVQEVNNNQPPPATNTLVPSATNTLVPSATNTLVPPTATNTLEPAATDTLTPLGAPANLTGVAGDNGITLSWEAPAGPVDGYEVMRRLPFQGESDLQTYVADTGSSATSWTDSSATVAGERYVYRVKALRGGAKSDRSNFVRIDR